MQQLSDLDAARAALARHSWQEAFDLFIASDAELTPQDLEGLAESAWWTAQLDACIEARERAFELYRRDGDNRRAALTAIGLTKDHFQRSESSIGMAWFRRAETLLDEQEVCAEVGYLERMRSVMALEGESDFEIALQRADAALAIAESIGDRDLLAISLHDRGRALIGLGRIDEGSALMDEANLAAVAGELSPFWTAAVFCNTITMCKEIADYSRAGDWTEAAKRWCERQSIAGFPGMCRVYRAGILRVRGGWREAVAEALKAAEETATFNLGYAAEAFNELGEVRLEMGDLDAAEDAFAKASELGRDPQPGFALLQLARGNPEGAWQGLKRALDERESDLQRVHLLPAAVEVAIAVGDLDTAGPYVDELRRTADVYRTIALRSAAITSEGRFLLATGDADRAIGVLRRAVQSWRESDMPYEMAQTRELLGRALEEAGDEDAARLERAGAASVLERLGAEARDDPDQDAMIPSDADTTPAPTEDARGVFRQEGEYWSIRYRGDSFLLRDSKGLHHLARLLGEPGRELHVLDLAGGASTSAGTTVRPDPDLMPASDDAGPVLDERAKAAYKDRLADLRDDLEEAQAWGDDGRAARAREEIELIAAELASAVGLGGRDRKAASTAEKARLNVTRSIRSTLQRIAENSTPLGEHLSATIRTGTFCAYVPDPHHPIRWET